MCGDELEDDWQVDHVLPLKRGGKNEIKNYLAICGQCNRLKRGRTGPGFRRLLQLGHIYGNPAFGKGPGGAEIRLDYVSRLLDNWARNDPKRRLEAASRLKRFRELDELVVQRWDSGKTWRSAWGKTLKVDKRSQDLKDTLAFLERIGFYAGQWGGD